MAPSEAKHYDRIVAIDGPAGAGKSTIARGAASKLGFQYLDTGAIYRTYTLAALRKEIPLGAEDLPESNVHALIKDVKINLEWDKDPNKPAIVTLDGEEVTAEIRKNYVTEKIRYIADMKMIRAMATSLQRQTAAGGRFICEGRDQGTVVFPNAFLKIYLWATPQERATRRFNEIVGTPEEIDMETLIRKIMTRDRLDMGREVGALKKDMDAIEVDSTELSIEQSIDKVVELAQTRMQELGL
ncbi:MAG: (d)CMP kinase [Planctomycetes bacterium]|nr:(d)CMP kinase [Planctomycetota bacterium]